MPKDKKSKTKRPCALDKQLAFDAKPYYMKKKPKKGGDAVSSDDEDEELMPAKLSHKTLELAKAQQMEVEEESNPSTSTAAKITKTDVEDSEEEEEEEEDMIEEQEDDLIRFQDGFVEGVEMDESDEQALEMFMPGGLSDSRNLADIIMAKIREKEAQDRGEMPEGQPEEKVFPPKVVEIYTGVGSILRRYTSGKLPKAFKVIPSLSEWEEILWLTAPEKWSPHSMAAATRLFASNLNPRMAQRFFNIFLLEHVRQDIRENRRLNFHLYMALKKALYKPQAFFKGIVLPLCEGRDCTLREATIIGSVLAKVSIPVIHSAAALLKLTEMPYSGANSLFIQLLLNKKYSLPTRVIAALSAHFVNFTTETRVLPVLWHQALLVFAQRYKEHISSETKEQMKQLFKVHFHHQITPEIRRELYSVVSSHH